MLRQFYLLLLTVAFGWALPASAQTKADIKAAKMYQKNLNKDFRNPEESPLTAKNLKEFKALHFFPVDTKFIVQARLVRTPEEDTFAMKTTTDRRPVYRKYGELHFELESKSYQLNVYQNIALSEKEEYRGYLFLPFTDLTNGEETYGGGRYIDLRIPSGDSVLIDFNRAYNPYCAYNSKYSCPIPPPENFLNTYIRAGVMAFGEHE